MISYSHVKLVEFLYVVFGKVVSQARFVGQPHSIAIGVSTARTILIRDADIMASSGSTYLMPVPLAYWLAARLLMLAPSCHSA